MKLGSDMTWWGREAADPANEMTYQCDADLGSPTAVDCAHLEYERLQPAGAPDTVQIGPGLTKVFTSGMLLKFTFFFFSLFPSPS